jgi:hypothetical protein
LPLKLVPGRHGSPYWYIRGSVRGIRVDESTGCIRQEDAEEVLITRSAEALKQSIHGDSAVRTFADAALSYITGGGDGQHMDPILLHFGPKKLLANIGQAEIEDAAKGSARTARPRRRTARSTPPSPPSFTTPPASSGAASR